ncbi:hypothetical protein Hypma_013418 [Hypsizygus marmoreus]|uniref:Uncharacterized protein n=1 Tax=Hypsizygus marmoreus TaxID=39966 RepID=A0A369JHY5_HYPMA|nr:hypothetical protein Hypma_013418 [Hypsizygus marmoreus]
MGDRKESLPRSMLFNRPFEGWMGSESLRHPQIIVRRVRMRGFCVKYERRHSFFDKREFEARLRRCLVVISTPLGQQ